MALVKDLYVEAAKDTRRVSRDYFYNAAFLSGNQWIYNDPVRNTPKEMPGDRRVRGTFNRMATNHRALLSHLTQREMTFEVPPNGADDASVHAAHIATEVLFHLHSEHNWERKREEVGTTMLKGGTGAIALDWDVTRNDSVETVLSIAEFVVEPGARDSERARWWIKAQLLSPGEAKAVLDLEEKPPADATNGLNPLQRTMLSSHMATLGQENDLTLVLTYYERPNPENPDGRFLVEVDGEIEQEGKWPFPFTDRLNLVVGTETVVENRWFGETVYTQARAPQVMLNISKSNLSEHLRDASIARLLVPHSAIRVMENLDSIPGHMYPFPDGVEKPSWLSPAQLPAWLQRLPDDYRQDVDDIMGVQDAFRGSAPGRIESGTGVAILVEQATSPVTRLVKEIAGMFSRMAQMELQLHEKMTKNKRFAVIDTDAGPLNIEWKGSDIAGQHFAKVPLDSIIPRSRAAQEAMATKMLEMGQIQTMADYARVADLPNRKSLIQHFEPNVAKAQRQHALMARGVAVLPAVYDDHAIMIAEHNKFRLTPAFERMSEEDQEKVNLKIQGHETLAAEAAAKMTSRAEAAPALAGVPTANNDPVPELPPGPEGGMPPELPAGPPPDSVEGDPMQMVQDLENLLA